MIPTAPRKAAVLALVVVATSLPRVVDLDRFVTTDERFWLRRSVNFHYALVDGRFGETYQAAHPGVTTMWAGAIAFVARHGRDARDIQARIISLSSGDESGREIPVESALISHGHKPLDLLVASRFVVVVVITAVLGLAFLAAARLIGVLPALLGFLLIALDPFHIGLSRLLHVDAMMSSFALLSLLLFLNYVYRGQSRLYLVGSAVAAGAAWLTKTPALILMPFLGLFLLYSLWREWRANEGQWLELRAVWRLTHPYALWVAIGALVFVALWPAMWVDPIRAPWQLVVGAGKGILLGHSKGTYFGGDVIEGGEHPGLLFYPVSYLWRVTPVALVGLAVFAVAAASRRAPWRLSTERVTSGALVLFAVVFVLGMSMGSKQFDRYLLAIYAPLHLVAAMGWVFLLRWLRSGNSALLRIVAAAVVVAVPATHGALALQAAPYYLTYYNPLLGGPQKASESILVGWGEGLDQAARYLNDKPDSDALRVVSWYGDGPFGYFFEGHAIHYRASRLGLAPRPSANHSNAAEPEEQPDIPDYVVLYVNQWQRQLAPQEILARRPEHVVRLGGVEYARIYNLRQPGKK